MAKSNDKKRDFFWLSYSDLMTSLFFIMLVLFVLIYSMNSKVIEDARQANEKLKALGITEGERQRNLKALEAKAQELERIKAIDAAIKELEKGGLYEYNSTCKRFELKSAILFEENSAIIPKSVEKNLILAGSQLNNLLKLYQGNQQVKFIDVIEGRAARHENARQNLKYKDNVKDLGYSRSLALYNLWMANGITLNNNNSEVFISSTGFDGLCRYSGAEEGKNKRFIIQVIPYLIK
ncbi:MAG: flagellar motor protein MotB [Flavobacterium sp.]|nr:flagellar motor protein MotB [Flavobacterium sp.]